MIIVTVDPTRFENPIHQGMHVLAKLRERGVPVVGELYPAGVARGTLAVAAPDLAGEVAYCWQDDEDALD